MRTLILAAIAAMFVTFSTGVYAQDEDFDEDFSLGDEEDEALNAELEAEENDAEVDAEVEEKTNPDLFEVEDWIMLNKLIHFVDRYWYTVINRDYVSNAKGNAETQLGDAFSKVQLLFGKYGLQVPFNGLGDEIDTEIEAQITSYAEGHGCSGNEQSDDCNTLFGKLESAHSASVSGVNNVYARNSTKLMKTAAQYDGTDKIILGLGALAMATPGIPEENRPWDLSGSDPDFNGVPVDFEDIEEGDIIIARGDDGAFVAGTVTEKADDDLTITDENDQKFIVSSGASFWTLGEGGGNVNLGSGMHIIIDTGFLGIVGSDIKNSMLLVLGGKVMWTPTAASGNFGVFLGGYAYRAWGTSEEGFENHLTKGGDRWAGAGSGGVMVGVNMSQMWRFEGTAAMLFNGGGIGGEITAGFTVTPHPVVSIGFGGRTGYYPGYVSTGFREYSLGGPTQGPNLLDRVGFGGFLTIGINFPIGGKE